VLLENLDIEPIVEKWRYEPTQKSKRKLEKAIGGVMGLEEFTIAQGRQGNAPSRKLGAKRHQKARSAGACKSKSVAEREADRAKLIDTLKTQQKPLQIDFGTKTSKTAGYFGAMWYVPRRLEGRKARSCLVCRPNKAQLESMDAKEKEAAEDKARIDPNSACIDVLQMVTKAHSNKKQAQVTLENPTWNSISLHLHCVNRHKKLAQRATKTLYLEHHAHTDLTEEDETTLSRLQSDGPRKDRFSMHYFGPLDNVDDDGAASDAMEDNEASYAMEDDEDERV
jgi:hypothetical protein